MMQAEFSTILNKKEPQILSRWQAAALSPYENALHLSGQKPKGRFADPISYLMMNNTREIWKWLIKAENDPDIVKPLEEICRMKAVQEPRPSKALSFIFDLKQIIREELEHEHGDWESGLRDIDRRIDETALLAFDIYSECRARIYEIKVNETKRMYGRD